MNQLGERWNPALYRAETGFVIAGGRSLLEDLTPRVGERVLDLGSGTGELTRAIADRGANVVGIDASAAMVAAAKTAHPELRFELGRGEELEYEREFDAIFSNATLHWLPRADVVASAMCRALVPGGRLVAEFGGAGNVAAVRRAVDVALRKIRPALVESWCPWYFPRLGEYAAVLERAGFQVMSARTFARPSRMPDTAGQSGVARWLQVFARELLRELDEGELTHFFAIVEGETQPRLFRDGSWWIDYVRLRVMALRPLDS